MVHTLFCKRQKFHNLLALFWQTNNYFDAVNDIAGIQFSIIFKACELGTPGQLDRYKSLVGENTRISIDLPLGRRKPLC